MKCQCSVTTHIRNANLNIKLAYTDKIQKMIKKLVWDFEKDKSKDNLILGW